MDPILYHAEPDGRLIPLSAQSMCRAKIGDAWMSLSAAGLVARTDAGTWTWDQVAAWGYLRPYRPQSDAPYGWADAVFGHTPNGLPCALVLPAEAPPPPPIEDLREAALAALAEERNARVDLYTGADARARDNRLMASVAILDRVQSGTATATDLELMAALRQVQPLVLAHDAAARAIRADILAASDPAALESLRAGLPTDARWPT